MAQGLWVTEKSGHQEKESRLQNRPTSSVIRKAGRLHATRPHPPPSAARPSLTSAAG